MWSRWREGAGVDVVPVAAVVVAAVVAGAGVRGKLAVDRPACSNS